MVGFSPASLFSARKREAVIQGETMEPVVLDHLAQRRTHKVGIVKDWEYKRDRGRISDTFTFIKQE